MSSSETGTGGSPRLTVALFMALVGCLFFFFMLEEDVKHLASAEWSNLPKGLVLRYLLAMAVGGAVAGWLLSGMFGRGGLAGGVVAALGGVLASMLAGLIGSAFARIPDVLADGLQMSELVPLAAGFLIPVFAMADQPLVFGAWVVLIVLTHSLAKRKHRGN